MSYYLLEAKMKVQLFSDLHYEFFKRDQSQFGSIVVKPEVDVILLLGDIDYGPFIMQRLYDICYKWGKQVIYLPGNHEFYGQEMLEVLELFKHKIPGIHILTGIDGFGEKEVIIDNVRFLGGTLWTDFALYKNSVRMPTVEEAMKIGAGSINDFRKITYKGNPFTPENSVELHKATIEQIIKQLETPFNGKQVLLSHHGVHNASIHPHYSADSRYLGSKKVLPGENPSWTMNPCFSSHLPELLNNFDFAFHGHTHKRINFKCHNERKTQIMANPRGYPLNYYGELRFENPEYNDLLVIEID